MSKTKTANAKAGMEKQVRDFPDPNTQISMKLRELYNSVQDEGIPDRFLDLLERLDEAEKNARANNNQ